MERERELIVASLPRLRRYARALSRNPGDADDLVQDTVERGLEKLAWWRPGGDMRSWLFGIMHNLYVDHLRAPAMPCTPLDEALQAADPGSADAGVGLDLDAALAALPSEQREVLLLVVLEGLSYAEVAAALRIPQGTVMSRLARARERLRRELAQDANDPVSSRLKVVK
ncbi:sigma-70 family RNA polymerase sigma factor [Oxalobacteraceae bacterium OM1]|nr:sigma-70 family RNA polymerase sigma factor [Oxalobacteraceae bacterium OM1]